MLGALGLFLVMVAVPLLSTWDAGAIGGAECERERLNALAAAEAGTWVPLARSALEQCMQSACADERAAVARAERLHDLHPTENTSLDLVSADERHTACLEQSIGG